MQCLQNNLFKLEFYCLLFILSSTIHVTGNERLINNWASSTPEVYQHNSSIGVSSHSIWDSVDWSSLFRFRQQGLVAHNKYRMLHGVGLLRLNNKLNRIAQTHAEYLGKIDRAFPSQTRDVGENLYIIPGFEKKVLRGSAAVDAWYSEIVAYTFGEPSVGKVHITARFSQLIWRDATQLGMGYYKTPGGNHYVVANYRPRGNIIGQFAHNVPRPMGMK